MHTICFDLDGTLTDPKEGITKSIQYALKVLDRPCPSQDELTWCIGPPLLDSFKTLVGNRPDAERALTLYRERYSEIDLYENKLFPGIPETLGQLTERGYALHVATSKPTVFAARIIEHFDLSKYFGTVFGSELDGTRADKTDLLTYVLGQTGADPARTTMIGDRRHDITGARNNALTAIGVLYGYGSHAELTEAGAHRICAVPQEIPDQII